MIWCVSLGLGNKKGYPHPSGLLHWYDYSSISESTLNDMGKHITWHIEAQTKWLPFRRRHFQMHFLQWISITISLKFVPKGPIDNIPALLQIMAWRRPGWCIYASLGLNNPHSTHHVLNYGTYYNTDPRLPEIRRTHLCHKGPMLQMVDDLITEIL